MKNDFNYFLASFLSSGIKTVWYAFTIPASMRKFIEKDESYKSHKDALMKIAETKVQDEYAERYIEYGDLAGFAGGLTSLALYAKTASENPDLIDFWIMTNFFSLGYETMRGIEKIIKHLKK